MKMNMKYTIAFIFLVRFWKWIEIQCCYFTSTETLSVEITNYQCFVFISTVHDWWILNKLLKWQNLIDNNSNVYRFVITSSKILGKVMITSELILRTAKLECHIMQILTFCLTMNQTSAFKNIAYKLIKYCWVWCFCIKNYPWYICHSIGPCFFHPQFRLHTRWM